MTFRLAYVCQPERHSLLRCRFQDNIADMRNVDRFGGYNSYKPTRNAVLNFRCSNFIILAIHTFTCYEANSGIGDLLCRK